MKETFIKSIKYIIENEGACLGLICRDCPFGYEYNKDRQNCYDIGISSMERKSDKDPALLLNAKKWLVENTKKQLEFSF